MDPQTTIDQIGRLNLGYVGARNYVSTPDSLRFTVGRGDRVVTVTLDGDDTYSVTTQLKRTGRVIFERTGVYCDQLSEQVYQAHLELNKLDTAAARERASLQAYRATHAAALPDGEAGYNND